MASNVSSPCRRGGSRCRSLAPCINLHQPRQRTAMPKLGICFGVCHPCDVSVEVWDGSRSLQPQHLPAQAFVAHHRRALAEAVHCYVGRNRHCKWGFTSDCDEESFVGSSFCVLAGFAVLAFCVARRKPLLVCSGFLTLACCFAEDAKLPPGSIAGEIFNTDAGGQRAVVPGALISLRGPVERQTESDAIGQYRFELLPPGRYTAEATAPGLKGAVPVDVAAGETADAPIPLELTAVTTSVTVTAADSTVSAVATQSAQSTTITQATVDAAPVRNEKVENLLPLVPGVVRGPDGRINMKGARSTQGGWLVNSANVTDPATGAEAMNLPIDVVSSVQVISNPYDPEYGRFTGAVSSVETKTGSLDKYHLSIQNLLPRLRDRDGDIVGLESLTPRLTFTGPLETA